MKPAWQPTLNFFRTVHIYLALLGLVLLFFFSLTGLALNHGEWFGLDQPHPRTIAGSVPANLAERPDELAIVEYLRAHYGATGAVVLPIEVTDSEIRVNFRRPGRRFGAVINRPDGQAQIEIEEAGVSGLLTDLHKGDHAGRAWKLCIDGAAGTLMLASISGVVLWLPLPRRRRLGLAALAVGIAAVVAAAFATLR